MNGVKMTVEEVFRKGFLFESKNNTNRLYKIFYKIDIYLKKNEQVNQAPENTPPNVADTAQAPVANNAETGVENPAPVSGAENIDILQNPIAAQNPVMQTPADNTGINMDTFSSVVTEDDETEVTDDNIIVRKLNGDIVLTPEEINDIQSIDDIFAKLQQAKNNNAAIFDDLTAEILQNLTQTNQLQQDLEIKVDIKESSIFAEIIYGKKLEESVGLRLIKRKNSTLVSNSMLIDNQIVNSRFDKARLDAKIVDMRNEEYSSEK